MNREAPLNDVIRLLEEDEELRNKLAEFFVDHQSATGFFSALVPPAAIPSSHGTATICSDDVLAKLPEAGESIGDYELLQQIARGGMGVVFKARQMSLDRIVALKVMRKPFDGSTAAARFVAEAQAVAKLSHPHIVPIYEVGSEANISFFTMKFFEGGTLGRHAATIRSDLAAIAELMIKIGHAIEHAHRRGILHRDLKPSNVLIDQDGQPYVADFGLAKQIDVDSNLTRDGAIVGTPNYMAPEQARGPDELTTACDVYGLGAILYELLSGQPPFQHDSPTLTLLAVVSEDPVPLQKLVPTLDRDLATICMKCLEKQPTARYGSAQGFSEDLQRYLRGEPIRARATSNVERCVKWARRKPAIAILITLLMFSIVTGSLGSAMFAWDSQKRAKNESKLRAVAERQTVQANNARAKEEQLRLDTQRREREVSWRLYSARIRSAGHAFEEGRLGHVEALLSQTTSAQGQPDFRGWEWYYHQSQLSRQQQTLTQDKAARGMSWHAKTGLLVFHTNAEFQVWDVDRRKRINRFPCPPDVIGYSWSDDGAHFAVGCEQGAMMIYEAKTGKKTCEYQYAALNPDSLVDLAWRPGHAQVACVNRRNRVALIDANTGDVVRTFPRANAYGGPPLSCDWNSNGSMLAISNASGVVKCFDPELTKPVWEKKVDDFAIVRTRWSPDDSKLALCTQSYNGEVLIIDNVGNHLRTLAGHRGARVNDVKWIDNDHLISGGQDQLVKKWNINTGEMSAQFHLHNGEITSLDLSPDRRSFAATSFDCPVKIASLDVVKASHKQWQPHDEMVLTIDWHSDGTRFVSGGHNQPICIWDVASAKLLQQFPIDPYKNIFRLDLSPDQRWVVANENAMIARILETDTGKSFELNSGQSTKYIDATFSHDAQTLIVTCNDGTMQWWDTHTWQIRSERKNEDRSLDLAWSPDDKTILAVTGRGRLTLVDASNGESTISEYPKAVQNPSWRPDGEAIVAAGLGGELAFYASNQINQPIHLADGHFGTVCDVDWSPDGSRIASCGVDATVRIWDAATADLLLTIPTGNESPMTEIRWSPNGDQIAATDQKGTIYLFGEKGMLPDRTAIDSWDQGVIVQSCPLKNLHD
ncbi:serine/threonine-protein kinase [Aporhodopirellula aestuarii]|uniref:Serine/threonine-protein kinase n=1 Tax=Aporhodopirellula aestuarii TaxID=2950107 RepID=A0ABT0U9V7_9BACT|nr:serine/threonine-protein kinase [Aporhodopirellula aestuarii]MCM2373315.1 serine/threonine-protein kinase [Aporhodopirellula aestuarii]